MCSSHGGRKGTLDSLDLEFGVIDGYVVMTTMWVLGTKRESPGKAASALTA